VNPWWATALALVVDRVTGDPLFPPHPVILMGRYITWYDNRWNRPDRPGNRWRGIGLTLSSLVLFGGVPLIGLTLLGHWSPLIAWALSVWLIATTVAWKGLADAGLRIWRALDRDGLDAARAAVGEVVGRDTETLDTSEVVRAGVETLAENVVDAIVAPALFAVLGGAPLALTYRVVNTLDAMVGHLDARYRSFGWASARLDDLLNWVPARLTVPLMVAAARWAGLDARNGWHVARRDGRAHPSPNSGWPEAAMAGVLHVRLGGWNSYRGVPSWRPYLGDPDRPLEPRDLLSAVRVVNLTTVGLLILLAAGGLR
jgi:adenosylcobinamide-phosphate synthase